MLSAKVAGRTIEFLLIRPSANIAVLVETIMDSDVWGNFVSRESKGAFGFKLDKMAKSGILIGVRRPNDK